MTYLPLVASQVNKRVPEVKFTAIITKYKELRQSGSLVHHIPLKTETDRGDIIKFYNAIYIPTMKVVLTQFTPKDTVRRGRGWARSRVQGRGRAWARDRGQGRVQGRGRG